MKSFAFAALLAMCSAPLALANEVTVSGNWIKLGDVAPVSGEPASRPIAAAPLVGQRLPLSEAFIESQAQAAGYPVDLPTNSVVWVTRQDNEKTQSTTVNPPFAPAKVPDDGLIPVLNVRVNRGEAIQPDMLTYVEPDPKRRIQGLIQSDDILLNTEAKRTLQPGRPLKLTDIQPVSVIRKGETVQIVYQVGALRLTVNGRALTSAAAGDTVRIMNLQSKSAMDAIAHAPGVARIGAFS